MAWLIQHTGRVVDDVRNLWDFNDPAGSEQRLRLALVGASDTQAAVLRTQVARALERARAATDPAARAWSASILNNLGMTYSDLGRWELALSTFEEALAERRTGNDAEATDAARWMVAWALRNLGRTAEALAQQRALKADLVAAGREDPYVDEEIALLEQERE